MNQEFAAKATQMMKSYGFEIGMMVIPTEEDCAYQIMAVDEIKTIKNGKLHIRVMEASPLRTLKTVEAKDLIECESRDYARISLFKSGTLVLCPQGYGKVIDDSGVVTREVLIDGEEVNVPIRNLKLPTTAQMQEMKRKIRDVSSNESFLKHVSADSTWRNNGKRVGDFQ